jgi:DNA-binding IclR family transcriptional regulator
MNSLHETIWAALLEHPEGMRLTDIEKVIGYRTSVFNILIAMERNGYLVSEDDQRRYYASHRIKLKEGYRNQDRLLA